MQRRTLGTLLTGVALSLLLALAPPAEAAPPANDMFAAGEVVAGDTVTATGTTVEATKETGEPNHGGSTGGSSIWFRWTAPANRVVTVNLAGSASFPALAAYTGTTVDGLIPVASTWDGVYAGIRFSAVAGRTYHLAVDKGNSSPGAVKLALNATANPANDDFAAAEVLTGTTVTATGSNVSATTEPGEPTHLYDSVGRTVWWTWTAPSTGGATVHLTGTDFAAGVSAYTGDSVSGLIRVATTTWSSKTARITFRAIAGTTYRIAVDGDRYLTPSSGTIKLNLSLLPPPENDAFATAANLGSLATAAATGRNDGASAEDGEPVHYGYNAPHSSVWYSWTAPKRGSLTIRADAGFGTVLAAYTGTTVSGLTRVANQPQAYNGGPEQIRIRAEAGVTYRIAVDSTSASSAGTFNLSLKLIDSPPNDDFADAQVLVGSEIDVDGTNVGATQEPGEPLHDDNYYDPSVWYSWTAPSTGGVTLDLAGSQLDAVHGVYVGDSVGALARVTSTRSPSGTRTKRTFRAAAGVTYRIAIDGARAQMGTFHLALDHTPPPANDMFAAATPITGSSVTVSGNNIGATGENAEPNPGGTAGASVWYRWTAPSNGVLKVSSIASDFAMGTAVFTGTSVDALTPRGSWSGANVEQGVTYSIAVHGGGVPARGTFTIQLTHHPAPANDAFATATPLTGETAEASGSNQYATMQPGEPTHCTCSSSGSRSVWFTWTAPDSRTYRLDWSTSAHGTVGAVHTGTSVDALTTVARASSYGANAARLTFSATAGTTYRFALADVIDGGGAYTLKLAPVVAPPNDAFASATALAGETPKASGSNEFATVQPGEPAHCTCGSQSSRSVWFTWTATKTERRRLDWTGSAYGTVAGVYTGDAVDGLTPVVRATHYGSGSTPVYFDATAGTTYRIALADAYGGTASGGTYALSLEAAIPPANDNFAQAIELTGSTAQATGTTLEATLEAGEPQHCTWTSSTAPSVWYRWTAPESGRVTLDYGTSFSNAAAAVYTGDAVGSLTTVVKSADYVPYQKSVVFNAVAGTTYRIAMSGVYGSTGRIALKLDLVVPPANDNLASAAELTGQADSHAGTTTNGSRESNEPSHAGWTATRSVWHSWTAPADGTVTVDTAGSSFDTVLGVYTGAGIASLTGVASNDNAPGATTSAVTFAATAGVTYRIAVDGKSASSAGAYALNLAPADPPAEDPPADDPPAEDPPAEDPPAEDPPAEDPPAEDPPADDPPAEDPPPSNEEQTDSEEQTSGGGSSAGQDPEPTVSSEQTRVSTAPAPAAPLAPPPAQPRAKAPASALSLTAEVPTQRLNSVLKRGLSGATSCSRACELDVKVTFTVVGRKGRAASTFRAGANSSGSAWVVKLSKAAKNRLRGAKTVKAVVKVTARSGGEVDVVTRRVTLRR